MNKIRLLVNRNSISKYIFKNDANLMHFLRFPDMQCWKCGKKVTDKVFCPSCGIVQKPTETKNYFRLFDIEEKFQVDKKILKDNFRRLQSILHPDKFTNKTNEEKDISAAYSSLLNKAYSNLLIPMKRAEHLLKLRGEKIEEEQTVKDPKFLMEMMELNEEVEEAGNDIEKLKSLSRKNREELEKLENEITQYFKDNDISKAKESIAKMKYFTSLNNRINEILRDLGVVD